MITSRGGPKYRPYGVGDLQGIVDKLPPVSEGGSRWLSELDSLTAGQRLALGDFRAVLYRCTSNLDAKEIEAEACTAQKKDDVPFTQVSTDLGRALRQRYPPPNAATVPKLKWDGESSPREFLDKTRTQWIQQTGSHPGKPGVQMEWYRQAILEGVPLAVKEAMKSNPDMAGCEATKWEKHLIHHLTQVQDKCQTEQDQLKELQTQLLKLQLGDARGKATEKKQQTPPKKVMVAEQQPDWPDLNPTPPWVEPHHPHQMYQGNYGGYRGRGGYRGGYGGRGGHGGYGGRGGYRGGNEGPPGACFVCGQTGHWARDCPHQPQQPQPQPQQYHPGPAPPRGRGGFVPRGGPPPQRGGHMQMPVQRRNDPWEDWAAREY